MPPDITIPIWFFGTALVVVFVIAYMFGRARGSAAELRRVVDAPHLRDVTKRLDTTNENVHRIGIRLTGLEGRKSKASADSAVWESPLES